MKLLLILYHLPVACTLSISLRTYELQTEYKFNEKSTKICNEYTIIRMIV